MGKLEPKWCSLSVAGSFHKLVKRQGKISDVPAEHTPKSHLLLPSPCATLGMHVVASMCPYTDLEEGELSVHIVSSQHGARRVVVLAQPLAWVCPQPQKPISAGERQHVAAAIASSAGAIETGV